MKLYKVYVEQSKEKPIASLDRALFNDKTLLPLRSKKRKAKNIVSNNSRKNKPTNILSQYGEMIDKFGLEFKALGNDKAGIYMVLYALQGNATSQDLQKYKGVKGVYSQNLGIKLKALENYPFSRN